VAGVRCVVPFAVIAFVPQLLAQSAADHVARGDAYRSALDGNRALQEYLLALEKAPNDADVLWRASSEAVDLGELNETRRDSLYRLGEELARRATSADSTSAMAHFALAKALGRRAQSLGARDRVRYAEAVRASALESLKRDSLNPGALHVMGMWNAEIMRLSRVERFFARRLLGGKTMSEASWDNATAYLGKAVTVDPERIVHRYELGGVFHDRGERQKARETWQGALSLRPLEPNDPEYRRRLEARLAAPR
jgi:tetratricopeptide (TPR) repeat protein